VFSSVGVSGFLARPWSTRRRYPRPYQSPLAPPPPELPPSDELEKLEDESDDDENEDDDPEFQFEDASNGLAAPFALDFSLLKDSRRRSTVHIVKYSKLKAKRNT
jgi:hypothetical protein